MRSQLKNNSNPLSIFKLNYLDPIYIQYIFYRQEQMRQATEKASKELNDPLLKHHKEIVQERGETSFDQM